MSLPDTVKKMLIQHASRLVQITDTFFTHYFYTRVKGINYNAYFILIRTMYNVSFLYINTITIVSINTGLYFYILL